MKKITNFIIQCIILLTISTLFSTYTHAANYYVGTDGNNSWNGLYSTYQGGTNGPWRDAWYGARQLYSGDTLYIKAGIYTKNPSTPYDRLAPGIEPIRSGNSSQPITIKAYPGAEAFGSGPYAIVRVHATNNAPNPGKWNPAIGTSGYKNIVIDGLKIEGAAAFWGDEDGISNNCYLQNCDISIGGDGEFGCCVRIEKVKDCYIRNNRIHDNILCGDVDCNTQENSPLIQEYDSLNIYIENNEFYNSYGYAIRLKDNPVNIHIRKNIIRNSGLTGFYACNQDDPGTNSAYIYQNIFMNNTKEGAIKIHWFMHNIDVYNNVFYNNSSDIFHTGYVETEINFWNNIHQSSTHYVNSGCFDGTGHCFLDNTNILNYNCYYNGSNWYLRLTGGGSYQTYTTLTQWKSASGKENNSIAVNPLFVNAGVDFHLQSGSPCINSGIDRQDYDKDGNTTERMNMGCYITGNEVIGRTSGTQTTTTTTAGGDTVNPTINITQPTSGTSYATDDDTISISGTASDNVGVTSVTWSNNVGGSGNASGTTNWTISNVTLHCGNNNNITVRATDAAGNSTIDQLTVDVKPCEPEGLTTQ